MSDVVSFSRSLKISVTELALIRNELCGNILKKTTLLSDLQNSYNDLAEASKNDSALQVIQQFLFLTDLLTKTKCQGEFQCVICGHAFDNQSTSSTCVKPIVDKFPLKTSGNDMFMFDEVVHPFYNFFRPRVASKKLDSKVTMGEASANSCDSNTVNHSQDNIPCKCKQLYGNVYDFLVELLLLSDFESLDVSSYLLIVLAYWTKILTKRFIDYFMSTDFLDQTFTPDTKEDDDLSYSSSSYEIPGKKKTSIFQGFNITIRLFGKKKVDSRKKKNSSSFKESKANKLSADSKSNKDFTKVMSKKSQSSSKTEDVCIPSSATSQAKTASPASDAEINSRLRPNVKVYEKLKETEISSIKDKKLSPRTTLNRKNKFTTDESCYGSDDMPTLQEPRKKNLVKQDLDVFVTPDLNSNKTEEFKFGEKFLLHILLCPEIDDNCSLLHILLNADSVEYARQKIFEAIESKVSAYGNTYISRSSLNYKNNFMYNPWNNNEPEDNFILDLHACLSFMAPNEKKSTLQYTNNVSIISVSLLNEIDSLSKDNAIRFLIETFWSSIISKLSDMKAGNSTTDIVNTIQNCAQDIYRSEELQDTFCQLVQNCMQKFYYKDYLDYKKDHEPTIELLQNQIPGHCKIWFQPNLKFSDITESVLRSNWEVCLESNVSTWKELSENPYYVICHLNNSFHEYTIPFDHQITTPCMLPIILHDIGDDTVYELSDNCSTPLYLKRSYVVYIATSLIQNYTFDLDNSFVYLTNHSISEIESPKFSSLQINPILEFERIIYSKHDHVAWNDHIKSLKLLPFYIDPVSLVLDVYNEYVFLSVFIPNLSINNTSVAWDLSPIDLKKTSQVQKQFILQFNVQLYFFVQLIDYANKYYQSWLKYICTEDVNRMKNGDRFLWGILPVRAMDHTDQWVPVPSGLCENSTFCSLEPVPVSPLEWYTLQPDMQKICDYAINQSNSNFKEIKKVSVNDFLILSLCMSSVPVGMYEIKLRNRSLNKIVETFIQNHATIDDISSWLLPCVCAPFHSSACSTSVPDFENPNFNDCRGRITSQTDSCQSRSASVASKSASRNYWLQPTYENRTGPSPKWKRSALLRFGYLQDFPHLLPVSLPIYVNDNLLSTHVSERNVFWTEDELQLFLHRYSICFKDFRKISSALCQARMLETTSEHVVVSAYIPYDDYRLKSDRDCVDLYYCCKSLFQLKNFTNSIKKSKSKNVHKLSIRQKFVDYIMNKLSSICSQLTEIKRYMENSGDDIEFYSIVLASFKNLTETSIENTKKAIDLISSSQYLKETISSALSTDKGYTSKTLKAISAINTIGNILYGKQVAVSKCPPDPRRTGVSLENISQGYFMPRFIRMLILPPNQNVMLDSDTKLHSNLIFADPEEFELVLSQKPSPKGFQLADTHMCILLRRLLLTIAGENPIGFPSFSFLNFSNNNNKRDQEQIVDNLYFQIANFMAHNNLLCKTQSPMPVITSETDGEDFEQSKFPSIFIEDEDDDLNARNSDQNSVLLDTKSTASLTQEASSSWKQEDVVNSRDFSFESSAKSYCDHSKYVVTEDTSCFIQSDDDDDSFSSLDFFTSLVDDLKSKTCSELKLPSDPQKLLKNLKFECVNESFWMKENKVSEQKMISTILNYKPESNSPLSESKSSICDLAQPKIKEIKKPKSTLSTAADRKRKSTALGKTTTIESPTKKPLPLNSAESATDKSDSAVGMATTDTKTVTKRTNPVTNSLPSSNTKKPSPVDEVNMASKVPAEQTLPFAQTIMPPSYISSDMFLRSPHPVPPTPSSPYLWREADPKYMLPMDPYNLYHFFPTYLYYMQPLPANKRPKAVNQNKSAHQSKAVPAPVLEKDSNKSESEATDSGNKA